MTFNTSMESRQAMIGRRVRLISVNDPWTRLRSGDEGTVVSVDCTGTVHVKWDSGSNLGLVEEAGDRFVLVN